jgi:hypothetical protein
MDSRLRSVAGAIGALFLLAGCTRTWEENAFPSPAGVHPLAGRQGESSRRFMEAEFGKPPAVVREGTGEPSLNGGLFLFKLEALAADGRVVQSEKLRILWPSIEAEPEPSWGIQSLPAGQTLLTSCGRTSLVMEYLVGMKMGEQRSFPRWGPVTLQGLNEREPRRMGNIDLGVVDGVHTSVNADIRVTLLGFCVPQVTRHHRRTYSWGSGWSTFSWVSMEPCS